MRACVRPAFSLHFCPACPAPCCPGGGLSSSAAIVCASAMAVMRMHGIEFTKGVSLLPLLLIVPRQHSPARPPLPALPLWLCAALQGRAYRVRPPLSAPLLWPS